MNILISLVSLKCSCFLILFSLLSLDHFLHVADKGAAVVCQKSSAVQARQHQGYHEDEVGEDGPGDQTANEC